MTDHPTRNLDKLGPVPPADHPTQRLDAAEESEERSCLRCGQVMILAEAATDFRRDRVIVRLQTNPGILAPHYVWSPCYALVCPHCGYTELYTVHPHKLVKGTP